MSLKGYWSAAREPRYSITFAIPLFLLYEGLAALLSHSAITGVRNGADVLLKTIFIAFGGRRGLVVFGALVCGAGIWLIARDFRKHSGQWRPAFLAVMLAESLAYALVFGFVVSGLTAILLHPLMAMVLQRGGAGLPLGTQLVVSLGAGIYEELLFRVLLVSGLAALGLAMGWRRGIATTWAIILSALIFSAFHYVGPYGDTLTLASFTFRAIAGVAFSGLYVARGFGITAWTHALYDVILTVVLLR
jgi:hypothetical protein